MGMLLGCAPMSHLAGTATINTYRLWQPLKGGRSFVYAQTAGAMNVVFYNASLAELETKTFNVSAGKNTLSINKEFLPGIYYADVKGSSVNLAFNHDEGNYTT